MNPSGLLKNAFLAALMAVALSSCASGPYLDPAAAGLPKDQLAVLEHPDPAHSRIVITYVDGKYRGLGIKDKYVLSPGKHVVRASAGTVSEQPGKSLITGGYYDLEFEAKAGEVYVIGVDFFEDRMEYVSYIKERSTGRIVSVLKEAK